MRGSGVAWALAALCVVVAGVAGGYPGQAPVRVREVPVGGDQLAVERDRLLELAGALVLPHQLDERVEALGAQ